MCPPCQVLAEPADAEACENGMAVNFMQHVSYVYKGASVCWPPPTTTNSLTLLST
jgi:hypothetical protein